VDNCDWEKSPAVPEAARWFHFTVIGNLGNADGEEAHYGFAWDPTFFHEPNTDIVWSSKFPAEEEDCFRPKGVCVFVHDSSHSRSADELRKEAQKILIHTQDSLNEAVADFNFRRSLSQDLPSSEIDHLRPIAARYGDKANRHQVFVGPPSQQVSVWLPFPAQPLTSFLGEKNTSPLFPQKFYEAMGTDDAAAYPWMPLVVFVDIGLDQMI